MKTECGNLRALRDACLTVASEFNEFWILAGLTDRSYEDGIKKRGFPNAVKRYTEAGVAGDLLLQLQNGVNGNLFDALQSEPLNKSVVRRTGRGQDLTFTHASSDHTAKIEVKLLFDCSYSKHYQSTADDWDKLAKVRTSPSNDDLFLVVFFQQMPQYDYPGRKGYLNQCGIHAQFQKLRMHMAGKPAGPQNGLCVHQLAALTSQTHELASKGRPVRPNWKLNPEIHLQDASVGFAIWQIP
jgi:hypothetical protein